MKIGIAADRGGYQLKKYLIDILKKDKLDIFDFGCHDPTSIDYSKGYPDYAEIMGTRIYTGEYDRGILICATGIGMSIAANKMKGIRCALVHDVFSAEHTRKYNDSNVLALGEMIIGPILAYTITKVWLNTDFKGNRKRIYKINEMENKTL
ncbi:RpiB/LacA/LacB family sugar-phosphate isomerase [Brevibacillus reuszeri]|uniref:RpiB/LacA/LacB family sugar-phosphate isomerase n=1 Tax=Brevibacillus reuszeri TaxID=54915 RepID=UPI003D1C316B